MCVYIYIFYYIYKYKSIYVFIWLLRVFIYNIVYYCLYLICCAGMDGCGREEGGMWVRMDQRQVVFVMFIYEEQKKYRPSHHTTHTNARCCLC